MKVVKLFIRSIILPIRRFIRTVKVQLQNPLVKLGDNVVISTTSFGRYVYLASHSQISESKIGDYSYCGEWTKINRCEIGRFTCIGPRVLIGLGNHPIDRKHVSIHPAFYSLSAQVGKTFTKKASFSEVPLRTTIGNDVWIGANVVIPGGITVGDGAVIASGAVVSANVAPFSIVGGVPAKLIRMRFDDDTKTQLQNIQWWNKDDTWLSDNVQLFDDVESLKNSLGTSGKDGSLN